MIPPTTMYSIKITNQIISTITAPPYRLLSYLACHTLMTTVSIPIVSFIGAVPPSQCISYIHQQHHFIHSVVFLLQLMIILPHHANTIHHHRFGCVLMHCCA
eukprot:238310_1